MARLSTTSMGCQERRGGSNEKRKTNNEKRKAKSEERRAKNEKRQRTLRSADLEVGPAGGSHEIKPPQVPHEVHRRCRGGRAAVGYAGADHRGRETGEARALRGRQAAGKNPAVQWRRVARQRGVHRRHRRAFRRRYQG